MHIFGYVIDGFQSLNHSAVLSSLVFLGVLVVYVLDWSYYLFNKRALDEAFAVKSYFKVLYQ